MLRAAGLLVVAVALCDVLVFQLGSTAPPASAAPKRVVAEIKAPTRMPQIKPAASRPTAEGATAFVLFWFDALNYSLNHGDTDLLVHWTGAGCRQCTGWLIGISRWKAAGATLTGGYTYPVNLAIGPFSSTEPVSLAATFLNSAATLTQRDGTAQRYPGGTTRGGLTVLWGNGRWQMSDIILDASQAGAHP